MTETSIERPVIVATMVDGEVVAVSYESRPTIVAKVSGEQVVEYLFEDRGVTANIATAPAMQEAYLRLSLTAKDQAETAASSSEGAATQAAGHAQAASISEGLAGDHAISADQSAQGAAADRSTVAGLAAQVSDQHTTVNLKADAVAADRVAVASDTQQVGEDRVAVAADRDTVLVAQQSVEQSELAASSSATLAGEHAQGAGASELKASQWADHPEDMAVPGELERYSAEHHATKADQHRAASVVAQANSETAQGASELAQQRAETAETGAQVAEQSSITARQGSEAARDLAQGAQAASETARDTTLGYRDTAGQHRDIAIAEASAAADSATAAAGSEAASQTSENLAKRWAEETPNTEIEPGKYSAKHHAEVVSAAETVVLASEANVIALEQSTEDYHAAGSLLQQQVEADALQVSDDKAIVAGHRTDTAGYRDQALVYKNDAETAAAAASGGLRPVGDWDASAGTNPPGPDDSTVPWYRISVAGIVPDVQTDRNPTGQVEKGDNIYWSEAKLRYVHIDNTERFTSINGYTSGSIELTFTDVGAMAATATTTDLSEGNNLYHTTARVRGTTLAGMSTTTQTAPTSMDTVLSALGKIVGKLWNLVIGDVSGLQSALDSKVMRTRKINNKDLTADITLTPADIGAADGSHSHGYADLPISSAQVSNWDTAFGWGDFRDFGPGSTDLASTSLLNSGSANDIDFVSWHRTTAGVANLPSGSPDGLLETFKTSEATNLQRYQPINTSDSLATRRLLSNGTWTDWVRLLQTGDFGIGTDSPSFTNDADGVTKTQTGKIGGSAAGFLPTAGTFLHMAYSANNHAQFGATHPNNIHKNKFWGRTKTNGVWNDRVQFWTTGEMPNHYNEYGLGTNAPRADDFSSIPMVTGFNWPKNPADSGGSPDPNSPGNTTYGNIRVAVNSTVSVDWAARGSRGAYWRGIESGVAEDWKRLWDDNNLVKVTSSGDPTAGRVLLNGSHGLGDARSDVMGSGDLNDLRLASFRGVGASTVLNRPEDFFNTLGSVITTGYSGSSLRHAQLYMSIGGEAAIRGGQDTWGDWKELWTTGNFDPNDKADANHTHSQYATDDHNHDGSYLRADAQSTLSATLNIASDAPIKFLHPVAGELMLGWHENYLRFRGGGTSDSKGIRLSHYNDTVLNLNRLGASEFFEGVKSTKGFFSEAANVISINRPGGALVSSGSNTVGAIKIRLPQLWTSTMMTMRVMVYDYGTNKSFEVVCGGYNFNSGGYWVNTFAYILGMPTADLNYTVRFGHDGDRTCIWIGEVDNNWAYPKVSVVDFVGGHSGDSHFNWGSGWQILFVTSFNTVQNTEPATQLGRSVEWANVNNKPTTATRWPTFSEVTSKPSSYPPSSHNHDSLYHRQDESDRRYSPDNATGYTLRSASDLGYTGTADDGLYAHLRGGTADEVATRTYTEAVADAVSKGARLPTIEELEANIAKGTGGGFDLEICWTCSPVPGRPGYVYAALGRNATTREEYATNGVQVAACRYVANIDVPSIWHAGNLSATQVSNWDTAHGWGDFRDFGLGTEGTNALVVDFNTLPEVVGRTHLPINLSNTGSTNGPPRGIFYYVQHIFHSSSASNCIQIAWPYRVSGSEPSIFYRSRSGGVWSAWTEVFGSGNILGTVSQSEGVPTGAVIERGSNANGEYVKFADGSVTIFQEVTLDLTTQLYQNFSHPVSTTGPRSSSISMTENNNTALSSISDTAIRNTNSSSQVSFQTTQGSGTVLATLITHAFWY